MSTILFSYIKKPVYISENAPMKFIVFVGTLMLFYLISIPSSVVIVILQMFNTLPDSSLNSMGNAVNTILFVVILGPILEELIFRASLRISRLYFSICSSVSLIAFLKLFFLGSYSNLIYLFFIPASLLLFFIFSYKKRLFSSIERFWHKNFEVLFYTSSVLFGMMHLLNYEDIHWWMIIISPLLTLPYIIMGLFLGFIRMNYGFFYAVVFHVVINTIGSVPILVKLLL